MPEADSPNYWGIIPASGIGQRFGKKTPKQYLSLQQKPIVAYAIHLLLENPLIQHTVVAIHPKDKYWRQLNINHERLSTTTGGETRMHSVMNALQTLPAKPNDWVIVHDAVRPLTTQADLNKLIDSTRAHDVGGILASPVIDTLKHASSTQAAYATIDRSQLWRALTPQIFRYQQLKDALHSATNSTLTVTDECQALELAGHQPLLIEGSNSNIKITIPDDLAYANYWVKHHAELYQPTPKTNLPRHVIIIMDGNGRWARAQNKLRIQGHHAGFKAVKALIEHVKDKIEALTLFAFSSENWQRPKLEVEGLMKLFMFALRTETKTMIQNNVQIKFIGDRGAFSQSLQNKMCDAEEKTALNTGLKLRIAVNYGGRWDILNAANQCQHQSQSAPIEEAVFRQQLALADLPEPDLLIRTANEHRISNFLLWQLAYTELYFADVYWPDFTPEQFDKALIDYANRQRRFGKTGEQVYAEG